MRVIVILIICRGRYQIKKLFQRGIFAEYPLDDTKSFLKENLPAHENIRDDQIKSQYINVLERAEDFFVHKFSFGKVCMQIIFFYYYLEYCSYVINQVRGLNVQEGG